MARSRYRVREGALTPPGLSRHEDGLLRQVTGQYQGILRRIRSAGFRDLKREGASRPLPISPP
jgi:hypothetical protein